jgi:hypothetical protein
MPSSLCHVAVTRCGLAADRNDLHGCIPDFAEESIDDGSAKKKTLT